MVTTPDGTREFEIVKLVTIHDERRRRLGDAPRHRHALLAAAAHRARPHRHRHGRRVSRRRAARAARSRRQGRPRRRPRHRRGRRVFAAVDGGSGSGKPSGSGAARAPRSLYGWRAARGASSAGRWRCRFAVLAVPVLVQSLAALARHPLAYAVSAAAAGSATAGVARAFVRPLAASFDQHAVRAGHAARSPCCRCSVAALVPRRRVRRCAMPRAGASARRRAPGGARSARRSIAGHRRCWRRGLWDLMRGAAPLAHTDAARSGSPLRRAAGREPRPARLPRAAVVVHDLDARRDLVFALVASSGAAGSSPSGRRAGARAGGGVRSRRASAATIGWTRSRRRSPCPLRPSRTP